MVKKHYLFQHILRAFKKNITSIFFFIEAVFETSQQGKPVILIGGHRFNMRNDRKGRRVTWRCVKKVYNCPARVVTVDNNILHIKNYHNHD